MDSTLRQTALFAALDDEAAADLRAQMERTAVRKGKIIFSEGDPGDRLFLISRGKVKLTHASGDGRESLFAILGPGDMFGELSLFDPGPRMSTAELLTDGEILSIGHDSLMTWLNGQPRAAAQLLAALAHRLRRTSEAMADLVFADVPGRVAKALLDLGARFGARRDDGLYVPHDLTQEELAQLVGASRETVNKALSDFVSRGWIALETRAVLILDEERLQRRSR